MPMNSMARQEELREAFRSADAISGLEGYKPTEFELDLSDLRELFVSGEIDFDEFLGRLLAHLRNRGA